MKRPNGRKTSRDARRGRAVARQERMWERWVAAGKLGKPPAPVADFLGSWFR